jgi:superfamily II DNA or RNA helicase
MINTILNLKTNDSIGPELAQRQLAVIEKSYKYLSRAENNVIYIADEVGLGKTYIAAGISSLFRHFSTNISTHKDLIIVPKENLQGKWQKELRNFTSNNYLGGNAILEADYCRDGAIKRKLAAIRAEDPVTIFKMSSFSYLAQPRSTHSDLYDTLLGEVFNGHAVAEEVLDIAWDLGFFNKDDKNRLKKITAYLLNALSPVINCLIIDEAHNYKHGLGNDDHDGSLRNELTARFLGAQEDKTLLQDFRVLRQSVKFPLAQKIVCLSATPKDRSLMEIKNQLTCFTNKHILSEVYNNEQLKDSLKKFMIRGNLEYQFRDEQVSRNQCRLEHRLGNTNKGKEPVPLQLEDSFESIFWQLMQYKSLKYLDQKNGASFETGMLAGFESYQLDMSKRLAAMEEEEEKEKEEKEYEQVVRRDKNVSQDANVVKQLVQSYQDRFSHDLPPHPKQSKLENEITAQLGRQEKSLVFVRRIATVYELEKRLLARYEQEVATKQLRLQGRFSKYNSPALKTMLDEFNEKHISENKHDLFQQLERRQEIIKCCKELLQEKAGHLLLFIKYAYDHDEKFRQEAATFIIQNKKNISQQLKEITTTALNNCAASFISHLEELLQENTPDETPEEELSSYFFSQYFKPGERGHRFRKRMLDRNWFELDLEKRTTFLSQLLTNCCGAELATWLSKERDLKDKEVLNTILRSLFRNGAGLLPAYVAYSADASKFESILIDLLEKPDAPFHFLLQEIKTILLDYDILLAVNFQEKDVKKIQLALQQLVPVVGTSGQDGKNRSVIASRFRMPGYPYVLVTTDIFREGEDLHTYCQNIYHYGIAWNPSDMEQRTGRIDRINSMSYRKLHKEQETTFDNKIHVFYPYLSQSVEVNQVANLLKNVNQFIETFNDIDRDNNYESEISIYNRLKATDIPVAITQRLRSKYDVNEFDALGSAV